VNGNVPKEGGTDRDFLERIEDRVKTIEGKADQAARAASRSALRASRAANRADAAAASAAAAVQVSQENSRALAEVNEHGTKAAVELRDALLGNALNPEGRLTALERSVSAHAEQHSKDLEATKQAHISKRTWVISVASLAVMMLGILAATIVGLATGH
jgi:hypothetical protein